MSAMAHLRPMALDDVDAVYELADVAFTDLHARLGLPPEPARPRAASLERFRHPVRTDPGGCWVATDGDGRLLGAAQALDRDGVWGLSLLVVHPGAQSAGLGRALLDRALDYAGGGRRGGIILSSQDPRALRRYALAGFTLEPAMEARGPVRRRPPMPDGVRAGGLADVADVDAIGRRLRGAGHGRDVPALLATGCTLLVAPGEGFVMHRHGGVVLLGARSAAVAADLLRAAMADAGEAEVGFITARQSWAVPVVLEAGLSLRFGGAVFTRGDVGPFAPYLPSGAYL